MTDAVKIRIVIPFQFEKLGKLLSTIHEIWLASDFHVAIQ
jgi:hypothetical protein